MADVRLTAKSELTTPDGADKIHVVDVSDTTDHSTGTSKWVTLTRILTNVLTFLGLNDVLDTSYTDKEGYAPLVTSTTITGADALKLTKIPTFADLYTGNTVIEGGIVWLGSLQYHVWANAYIINNVYYDIPIVDTVTLSNGDATHPRIDSIVINVVPATLIADPVVTIAVIEGTPAASPVKPTPDLTDQVEVSFRLVPQSATADTTTTEELIYDENTGPAAEWTNSYLVAGGDLADTAAPYSGTKSITFPAITSDYVAWTKASTETWNVDDIFNFALKCDFKTNPLAIIQLKLINVATGNYFIKSLNVNSIKKYGFKPSSLASWQVVSVPLQSFTASDSSETAYDKLEIYLYNTGAELEMDWINIQGELDLPGLPVYVKEVQAGTGITVNALDPSKPIVSSTVSASTGLEAIDEGSGVGWVKVGRTAANYGNVGLRATDLSYSGGTSSTRGATGQESFAAGGASTASGIYTVVGGGNACEATGNYATVGGGSLCKASGVSATVVGGSASEALGDYSVAGGRAIAYSLSEVSLGQYQTTYSPAGGTGAFDAADRIFNIGNGTGTGARNDAFTIYKNGDAVFDTTIRTGGYTVATLPAGATQGDTAFVTDATAPTYLATLTGGGAVVCPVFYNGTAWVSH